MQESCQCHVKLSTSSLSDQYVKFIENKKTIEEVYVEIRSRDKNGICWKSHRRRIKGHGTPARPRRLIGKRGYNTNHRLRASFFSYEPIASVGKRILLRQRTWTMISRASKYIFLFPYDVTEMPKHTTKARELSRRKEIKVARHCALWSNFYSSTREKTHLFVQAQSRSFRETLSLRLRCNDAFLRFARSWFPYSRSDLFLSPIAVDQRSLASSIYTSLHEMLACSPHSNKRNE